MHAFGGIEALSYEDMPCPTPEAGEVLVRIAAAGVGPWDAWVREGKSVLPQPLPLVLGSDLSGVVVAVGSGVSSVELEDAVFGVTNARFTGAYAEYAIAEAAMIAHKPPTLMDIEAAALPVVASTAWQMVFDHARITACQRVLVLGAAGSVGAYALQLASFAGAQVTAAARASQWDYVRSLGVAEAIDAEADPFELGEGSFDVVLDTMGGETLQRSFVLLRRGGIIVSVAAQPDPAEAARHGVRAVFFLVAVSTASLDRIAAMIEAKTLQHPRIGEVLPLSQARLAHEMLAGRPHKSGKIVLAPGS